MNLKFSLLLISMSLLTACAAPVPLAQSSTLIKPYVYIKRVPVGVACSGHTSTFISNYYVTEPTRDVRAGGGNCGGLNAAGYLLPEKWYPGMKVKVTWKLSGQDKWREVTTNIMRYEEAGSVYVHIFDHDQVRVISSARVTPASSQHPILQSSKIPPPEEQ